MEKSEKDHKKKTSKVSRLGETKKISIKEYLGNTWQHFLSLTKEKFFLLFLLSLFITLVNAPGLLIPVSTYRVGEVPNHPIKASHDLLMEDPAATEHKKQEAAASVLAVYDFNEPTSLDLQKRIQLGFQAMREDLKAHSFSRGEKTTEERLKLEKIWGIEITPGEFAPLVEDRFSEPFENSLIQLIQSVLSLGIVNSKLTLMNEQGKGIVLRKIPSNQEFKIREIERFPDLDEARDDLEKKSAYLLFGKKRIFRPTAVALAQKIIVPNLFFNKTETENRMAKAVQEVRPVLFQIKKGEVVVQEGEKITEAHLSKIQRDNQSKWGGEILWNSLGLALIWGLFVYMVYLTARRGGSFLTGHLRDLIFLSSLLALSLLTLRSADYLAQIFADNLSRLHSHSLLLALPIAAAPMMISLVLGPLPALLFGLVQAFLVVTFWDGNPELALYFAIAGLWSSMARGACHTRWDLFRMGFFLGLINMASILAFQIMQGQLIHWESPLNLLLGFLGGIFAGVIVTGFSPLIEKIFGFTTDMKLLERANMDQPLLRELMVQAPGTYHHSIIAGNMVEAAAEAIGANALLARVSAYYHDIGKIQKPLYFVENQMGYENKHEKLAPSMSSLILIAHVKDGVEMALQQKLEAPIVEIISQHHGTNLISFFYQKALDLKGGDVSQVSMEDFRYPGPKPQTREAGLVLLADSIEATSRTLVDPTPARIQGLVQRSIQNAFSDGQLDQCDLTLKDLSLISTSFIKILTGIFHHRIEYPETGLKSGTGRKKTNGDNDKQSAETDRPYRNSGNLSEDHEGLGYL
ncbi:MAG: HDIG domain-containing protein [Deltaproteobacteria bacterium]|nr:HDIG domain-containing protein [Deltaproteobacteria bacterium]